MKAIKTYTAIVALGAALALILSACGGGGDSSAGSTAPADPNAAEQVLVSNVDGVGDILVDPQGAALYASEEEANGVVLCTDTCLSFWDPLRLGSESAPAGGSGIEAQLGTTERPDGAEQITLDGRPLYRFTEDSGPGVVTGDGLADRFGDQAFTWHVATPTGITGTPGSTPPSGVYDS